MNLHYVPVMAAKQGEFSALSNLQGAVSEKIIPLFELPAKGEKTLVEPAIKRTAVKAGNAWSKREAFLDISKWRPDDRTETRIHVLEYAFSQFHANGVKALPVIGYDRWDDPDYSQALKNIRALYPVTLCIRLDREAIEDMGEPEYFAERMKLIMQELEVGPTNCYVMIDFADVSTTAIPDLIADAESAVDTLRSMGFGMVIIVGGSMPAGVNEAVNAPDAEGCIRRIEMMAWKAIFTERNDRHIVFGDYVIRNAEAAEGVIAPHANAKIRYTVSNQFFIVRGHSKQISPLADQHKELAQKLVTSPHYMGAPFSWGDSQILACSTGVTELRTAMGMIAVDSNHHIHAVVAEVFEHQRTVIASTASIPKTTT